MVEGLAKEGITLILVTHEMRFARDVGTKLVFMHMGKVHEEGPPKELFANPEDAGACRISWARCISHRAARASAVCTPYPCP